MCKPCGALRCFLFVSNQTHSRSCSHKLHRSAQVYEEGTHIMIPWFERPIIYDVRARPNVIQSTSGSRDLQMVRRGVLGLRTAARSLSQRAILRKLALFTVTCVYRSTLGCVC